MLGKVPSPPLMVVRADADHRLGVGHLMRSIALAQAWQDQGGKTIFLGNIESESLCRRLAREQIKLIRLPYSYPDQRDAETVLSCLADQDLPTGWLVVDGYHFDQNYQKMVRANGWHLLVIDDMGHLPEYHADILLNQNVGSDDVGYRAEPETQILRGERYILLRREFLQPAFPLTPVAGRARQILVTLGGADPDNTTKLVLEALNALEHKDIIVKVVVGPSNPYLSSLTTTAGDAGYTVELVQPTDDMPALMHWADLVISGGGTTCWELAHMGVPFAVVVLADNQEIIASALAAQDAAVILGRSKKWNEAYVVAALRDLINNSGSRQYIRQQAGKLVDGRGAERVVKSMLCYDLSLRSAAPRDCKTVFEWSNDPDTRRCSFQTEKISWNEHQAWFEKVLADPNTSFYIAETSSGEPLGQVRFEQNGSELLISVGLAPAYRGCGLGSRLIKRASGRAMQETGISKIKALVKKDNPASLRSFLKAGFTRLGEVQHAGVAAMELQMDLGQ